MFVRFLKTQLVGDRVFVEGDRADIADDVARRLVGRKAAAFSPDAPEPATIAEARAETAIEHHHDKASKRGK